MDGGRGAGGGRGKGKKGKAAKKKKAAAAQATATAASHKKMASVHHGGKKVGANHVNVQVVTVPHAAHNGAGEAKVSTEQTMTKSKRKRLKKQAAGAINTLLKKQVTADTTQQAKKSPPAAVNASAASPKTAVLTPPDAAVATAKPHVVSLTGGKKRKRHATPKVAGSAAENDAALVATTLATSTDGKKSPSVVKTKKTVMVVGHLAVLTSGATKTVATVASPKRKIAQIQTAASAASPKNETATTPRKVVKKIKAKPGATAIKHSVAAIPTATAPRGVSGASGEERQTKAELKKPTTVVSLSNLSSASPKTTKLGAVTLNPEAVQVKASAKVQQTPLASNPLLQGKSKTCASSAKSQGVTTPKILTKKRKTTTPTTAEPERSANNGKPARNSSFPPRTLATTPLSSWFLSKGCANFVKQVHFSDDDDNSSSDDDGVSIGLASNAEKASPKRRLSIVKKNPFLESLTTQSNWRSWYGDVDMHNLLDPPLAHVPEKLRSHEVTPLVLPEADLISSVPSKKAGELEMLEADIRREKQRGSAFSEQLLMMLQGKTVSGMLLEEEYQPLLQ
ncbi:uncharacterized protein KRP23_3688 [Phytophthora ramorum]|uniref:uncharacterized protein n=1 Tax=Phytophthora ramorum TaxID=164328 RepID=UPI0030A59CDE|nr:hypothetical protein KRP23_3688 [Phytophthora ramorum]